MITRRQSLKGLLSAAAATITAPMINRGWFQVFAESAAKYSARAIDLVQRATVVDMLNPFTLLGVLAPFKGDKRPTWFTNPETFTPANDLPGALGIFNVAAKLLNAVSARIKLQTARRSGASDCQTD